MNNEITFLYNWTTFYRGFSLVDTGKDKIATCIFLCQFQSRAAEMHMI